MPDPNPAALDFLLTRRSRPAKTLTVDAPSRAEIETMLTAAGRTPDHGKLEPFRFLVITGAARQRLHDAVARLMAEAGEAEEKIAGTPPLIKSPSGHVQQSPWISIANKQLELMARYMSELGLTPAARMKLAVPGGGDAHPPGPVVIRLVDRFGETSGEHRLGDPLPEGDDETSRRIRTIDNI